MTTERMNAYDLYVRCKENETFDVRVDTKYNEIKLGVEQFAKGHYYTMTIHFYDRKIGEYSEQDVMPTILNMLKEDGFCITNSSHGSQGLNVNGSGNNYIAYIISWGSDCPAVLYALDGPKYNENIIE